MSKLSIYILFIITSTISLANSGDFTGNIHFKKHTSVKTMKKNIVITCNKDKSEVLSKDKNDIINKV